MKKFLFDTWYGAFIVLCVSTMLFVAIWAIDGFFAWKIPMIVRRCGVLGSGLLWLLSIIVFIVVWIVFLVKRRWKWTVRHAVLGLAWIMLFSGMFFIVSLFSLVLPNTDYFADGLTIPPELEPDIVQPESGHESSFFITADDYDDDFSLAVFKSLSKAGGDDTMVTYDLSELAGLVRNRRDELMAYLARHPGWWLHEYRGCLCATRRLRVRGVWNHSSDGAYCSYSRQQRSDEDFEVYSKSSRFNLKTAIGFPCVPFGRNRGAEHPEAATVMVEVSDGRYGSFESCPLLGNKDFCVAIREHTSSRERRMTNAALAFLKNEFATFRLPSDAAKRGPEEFSHRNGMQPGIYNLTLRLNPGEPGITYLKAFEVTKGIRLSEHRLYISSNERIGWSQDPEEKFLYENEFTIYEGDWGKPYAARIEVWFRPDSGAPERKLMERICKIEGWQR